MVTASSAAIYYYKRFSLDDSFLTVDHLIPLGKVAHLKPQ